MDKPSSIERRDNFSGYKQKITEAVQSKDMEQLISALQDTNMALAGSKLAHFSEGAGIRDLRSELAEFFQKAEKRGYSSTTVYLGDGGLSRLVIAIEDGGKVRISLSYNSTDSVKKAWEILQ